MSKQIQEVQSEEVKFPFGETSIIKKLSGNSAGIFKSHFEQFITTQPGMTDLVNNICQNLTYNDLKSAKYVSKEFQVWISNSELFYLAFEADAVIDKVIVSINDSCFRKQFGKVLTDVYKSVIGNFNANMLKILLRLMKDYLDNVVKHLALSSKSIVVEIDEILVAYENYMIDLCVSFEVLELLRRFWRANLGGKDVQEMAPLQINKNMMGKTI